MGLDMNLMGEKFTTPDFKNPENDVMEDGFRVESKRLAIGYWRKHPDLHGYIVDSFADGKDDCQEIYLTAENIEQTIAAVKGNDLTKTEGFFFGQSGSANDQKTIGQLRKALNWLKKEGKDYRSIIYQASW